MNYQKRQCENVRENCGCQGANDDQACEASCYATYGMDYCTEYDEDFEVQRFMECGGKSNQNIQDEKSMKTLQRIVNPNFVVRQLSTETTRTTTKIKTTIKTRTTTTTTTTTPRTTASTCMLHTTPDSIVPPTVLILTLPSSPMPVALPRPSLEPTKPSTTEPVFLTKRNPLSLPRAASVA